MTGTVGFDALQAARSLVLAGSMHAEPASDRGRPAATADAGGPSAAPEPMLSVLDVAQRVGFKPCAIYRAIQRGELIAYKPAGRLRIREADFQAWLESTRVLVPEPRAPRPAPVTPLPVIATRRAEGESLRARVKASRRERPAA
jgi:excisionase family DNA binding protein